MRKSKLASICLYTSLGIILLNILAVIVLKTSSNLVKVISWIYRPIMLLSVITFVISIVSLIRVLISKKQLKGITKSITALVLSVVMFAGGFAQGLLAEATISSNKAINDMMKQDSIQIDDNQSKGEQDKTGGETLDDWDKTEKMFKEKMRISTIPEGPNEIFKGTWGSTVDEIMEAEKDKKFKEVKKNETHSIFYAEQLDDAWLYQKVYGFDEEGKLDSLVIEFNNTAKYDKNTDNIIQRDIDGWSPKGAYKHYIDMKEKLQKIYGEPFYSPGGEINPVGDVAQEELNDKSNWDELIGSGQLTLSSRFAAKDTSIELFVMDAGISDMFVKGQVSVTLLIQKNK